jgi:transposase
LELPEAMVHVTEHQAHVLICRRCGRRTQGMIPPEVLAHGFGPKLTACMAFLSGYAHCTKRTIREILQTILGTPMSVGSVSNAEREVAACLEVPYAQAQQAVRQATVKNVDETGWFRAGKTCWMWGAVTKLSTLFRIQTARGKEGLRDLLGDSIHGTIGSDRWWAYGIVDMKSRQVCWAHLRRDFQKWVDWGRKTAPFGRAGLEAAQKVFALWGDFRQGVLDRPGLRAALAPVREDLLALLQQGTQGDHPGITRFCQNLLKLYPAMWTFARTESVEPTNNLAERTLRPAVIWRKISYGNHSQGGCRFVERILTVVHTLRLQHRSVLAYLHDALAAHRAAQPLPALIPPRA